MAFIFFEALIRSAFARFSLPASLAGLRGNDFLVVTAEVQDRESGLDVLRAVAKELPGLPLEIACYDKSELAWRTVYGAQYYGPFDRLLTQERIDQARKDSALEQSALDQARDELIKRMK